MYIKFFNIIPHVQPRLARGETKQTEMQTNTKYQIQPGTERLEPKTSNYPPSDTMLIIQREIEKTRVY